MSEHRSIRDAIWATDLPSTVKLVALRLVEHWPRIFPGLSLLSKFTGLDERTVRSSIRELEEYGILMTTHNPGRGNLYQFLDFSGRPIVIPELKAPRIHDPGGRIHDPITPDPRSAPTPDPRSAEADPDLKQLTEADKGSRVARKRAATTTKTTIPPALCPDASCLTLAREAGVSLEEEMPQFIDHHTKNASRFADWQAAIRTWVRNSKRYGSASRARQSGNHGNSDTFAHIFRKATEGE